MSSHNEAVRNPTPLTSQEVKGLTLDCDRVIEVKHSDCVFYNDCLDQAVAARWKGFGCQKCTSYEEPSAHQKMMNLIRLRALDMAAQIMEEEGGPCRKRGVKPGADAKRTLKVVTAEEETVPLVEALGDD